MCVRPGTVQAELDRPARVQIVRCINWGQSLPGVFPSVQMEVPNSVQAKLNMNVHAIAGQAEQYHHGGTT